MFIQNMSDQTLYELAIKYFIEENKLAFEIFNKIAKHGAKIEYKNQAKYMLAQCYYFGIGVEKDFKTAFNIFLELSESKSHYNEAKECLAELYFEGRGMKEDNTKAFELYLELSKSESVQQNSAKIKLAKFYLNGKSDQQNSSAAKFELARCYEFGTGITKDINKSLQLYLDFSKSESFHQVHAFRWLAFHYLKNGEEENSHKYFKLYIQKAEIPKRFFKP
ncbi:37313_t:CDS:2 [Gigaspora margarita]|uniref:37313_t:CDS:1 n=1 Tax=Gigaspora margarita TaxID=4874 RepID=A0ABM8VXA1_GIGMA|nr:37313_t:CDS:2 [Gigaspora margarita]